jgi:hypothetical protein
VQEPTGLANIVEMAIRQIVREEVRAAMQDAPGAASSTTASSRWVTPPVAARELGISDRLVRSLIRQGRIEPRLRNVDRNPRQQKFLVNVDEVADVTRHASAPGNLPRSLTLAERAAIIRSGHGDR